MQDNERFSAPTIVDVARLAGVHPSTVSRVFSGKGLVKDDTAQLVRQVASQLGFNINRAARKLVKGQSHTQVVGIALPLMTHPFYAEIIKGINETFDPTPFNLMLFNLGRQEDIVFQRILEEGLAGLFVISHQLHPDNLSTLISHRIPCVFLDRAEESLPSIFIDNFQGGRLAALHLAERGCRRPVYLGEKTSTPQQDQRRSGFIQGLKEKGLELFGEDYIQQGLFTAEGAALRMLNDGQIDGLFCFCDEMAYGALEAMKTAGKTIPLVGFDDLMPSRYLGLTTIHQPASEMGRLGGKKLLEMMAGQNSDKGSVKLEPQLILRKS